MLTLELSPSCASTSTRRYLPERYPSYQTGHRRFQRWVRAGTLRRVLHALAADLHARGGLDLSETFIDGSFASAKKRAPRR
jgi:transposase